VYRKLRIAIRFGARSTILTRAAVAFVDITIAIATEHLVSFALKNRTFFCVLIDETVGAQTIP
jgi:hypothetical protein